VEIAAAPIPVETAVAERPPSFRQRFVGVLLRPRETFAGLQDPDAWLWPSVLLLIGYSLYLLAVALGTIDYMLLVVGNAFQTSTGGSSAATAGVERVVRELMPAIQVFQATWQAPLHAIFSWGARTLIFYGLAVLLGGSRPPSSQVLAMVGWAWVPLLFQYAGVALLMMALPAVTGFFVPLPASLEEVDARAIASTSWRGQAVFNLLSPFVIWNLVLCAIGVSVVFRLPRWKAAIVVLLPTLLQVGAQAGWTFFSTLMIDQGGTPPAAPAPNSPAP
jgi:hypothetical protein